MPRNILDLILRAPDDGGAASPGAAASASANPDAGAAAAAPSSSGGAAAAPSAAAAAAPPQGGDDPLGWLKASAKESGLELSEQDIKGLMDTKTVTPAAMLKRMRAAEKMVRGEVIEPPPSDPAKLGDWFKGEGIRQKLGVPDNADGYETGEPPLSEGIRPYFIHSPEAEKKIAEAAHAMGVPAAHFSTMRKAFYESIEGIIGADIAAAAADEQKMGAELKREWGEAYEPNLRLALETAQAYGMGEAEMDLLRRGQVVGSTALARILHELGSLKAEDGALKGGGGGAPADPKRTPAEWKAELDAFQAKNGSILMNREHPEHAVMVKKRADLMRLAGIGVPKG